MRLAPLSGLVFIVFSLVVAGIIAPSHGLADASQWDSWQDAKTLYDGGKFEAALKSLQANPRDTAAYYYNLGTLEYRLGKTGTAVAYLEKANRLQPHDPAIQHNLGVAREGLSQQIGQSKLDPASTWSEEIADHVSIDEIRGTLGLLGSLMALIWMGAYWRTRRLRKTLFQASSVLAFAGFAITCGLYAVERMAEAHPPVICTERQTVRSGPGDHFLELAQVEAGSKLRLLGPQAEGEASVGGSSSAEMVPPTGPVGLGPATQTASAGGEIWRQVRFSADGIGWVRASSLLLL